MWPLGNLRKHRRYSVAWKALLHGRYGSAHETMNVTVTEISLAGARLESASLRTDRHHLLTDHPDQLVLEILFSEGWFRSPVHIRWVRWDDKKQRFRFGVSFEKEEMEGRDGLRLEIRKLKRGIAKE